MFDTCADPETHDLVVQLIATPKADLDHYLVANHEVVLQEEGTLCCHSLCLVSSLLLWAGWSFPSPNV